MQTDGSDPASTLPYATPRSPRPQRRHRVRASYVAIATTAIHLTLFVVVMAVGLARSVPRPRSVPQQIMERGLFAAYAVLSMPLWWLIERMRVNVPLWPAGWMLIVANSVIWGVVAALLVVVLRRYRPRSGAVE